LRFAIGFVNTTTYGAGSRGIVWINEDHGNTCQFSLIADILSQLVKRPVSVLAPLLATNGSLANTAQIFQSDSSLSVLRFSNKLTSHILMWTFAVNTFGMIAIKAKRLKSIREIVFSKPMIQRIAFYLATMFIPVTIDVVYGQKFISRFSATDTYQTIVFKDNVLDFFVVLPGQLSNPLRMGFLPARCGFSMKFFPNTLSVFFGRNILSLSAIYTTFKCLWCNRITTLYAKTFVNTFLNPCFSCISVTHVLIITVSCAFVKTFTDRVVGVTLKSSLLARDFSEFAFSWFGLLLLEVLAAVFKLAPIIVHALTAKLFAITVRSNVDNAKVNSKNTFDVNWFRYLNITYRQKIKLFIDKAQIAFTALLQEKLHLTHTRRERNSLSTTNCPDRNSHFVDFPRKNAIVKRNCSMRTKNMPCLVIEFISVGNFADTAHNNLSRERKLLANIVISKFVQRKLVKSLCVPRLFTDIVASIVRCLKRLFEMVYLFWCRKEFYFRR